MQIRTISLVEMGPIPPAKVSETLAHLGVALGSQQNGEHYVVPIRDGKITSDEIFRVQWLDIINRTCCVKDGEICLKNGTNDVEVVRRVI